MRENLFPAWRTRVYLTLVGLWRRMTIGARLMLVDGDKVLLVRQSYVAGWQFPGGGVEPGETTLDAAMRETLEETGIQAEGTPKLHGIFHNDNGGLTNRDHVCFFITNNFYEARPFKPNAEILEIKWFNRHALPQEINEGARRRVDEYFTGAPPSQNW